MIEMKINNGRCELKVVGSHTDYITEAAVGYMKLTEAVAKDSNISFESAALLLCQNVMKVYGLSKSLGDDEQG